MLEYCLMYACTPMKKILMLFAMTIPTFVSAQSAQAATERQKFNRTTF